MGKSIVDGGCALSAGSGMHWGSWNVFLQLRGPPGGEVECPSPVHLFRKLPVVL